MVGEEGLGRGAAESVHGGVDPVGALCGLGELLEEEDHRGREGAGGLGIASKCVRVPPLPLRVL